MTTVPMADTVGPSSKYIPLSFAKAGGYRTGSAEVIWSAGDVARFKTTSLVSIDQSASLSEYSQGLADVADVETGAGTIESFIQAAHNRVRLGKSNNLYIDFANLPGAVTAIEGAGLDLAKINFWVADWNMNQAEASAMVGAYHLQLGNGKAVTINIVAVQWASPTSNPNTILPGTNPELTLKQSNVDLSETDPNWFPFVAPTPPPVVTTKTGVVVTNDLETFRVVSVDSGANWKKH